MYMVGVTAAILSSFYLLVYLLVYCLVCLTGAVDERLVQLRGLCMSLYCFSYNTFLFNLPILFMISVVFQSCLFGLRRWCLALSMSNYCPFYRFSPSSFSFLFLTLLGHFSLSSADAVAVELRLYFLAILRA